MGLKSFFNKLAQSPDSLNSYSCGISDLGQKRKLNEDSYLIDEKLGLFIVADGMGGHRAGEVASNLAVKNIFSHIKTWLNEQNYSDLDVKNNPKFINSETIRQVIQDAIEGANKKIHSNNLAQGISEGQGMGTTVTGFWISSIDENNKEIHTFNVGDSRCYSFYQAELTQLSTDHSHYQLWLDTGMEGEAPRHNIIYKAIGPWSKAVADQYSYTIHTNELFLLCSDGLHDMLSDQEIQDILQKNSQATLKQTTQALISAANNAGGKDNVTIILVKPN